VREALQEPVVIDDVAVEVGASVGIALAPEHGTDASGLLKRADLAMYDAKGTGTGLCVYEPSRHAPPSPQRLALVSELRQGLPSGQLVVYVQPKAALVTDQVSGVEALARWHHPQHGMLLPADFIDLAERSGLIRPLTMVVLDAALEAVASWRRQGMDLSVAVNLSVRSLTDSDLPTDVARLLVRHGVPAERLTLEITETSIMTDPARSVGLLVRLAELGVRLSVDDFGTGYSSLAYLKRLPVHEVKIDRSFVTNMARDGDDATIVRSIIDLGANLSLEAVAEGVEDERTCDELRRMGCATAQGYHLSEPMPVAQFPAWLQAYRMTHPSRDAVTPVAP
jgi:predicted signal transduction protein with EAL and GGDEF domain